MVSLLRCRVKPNESIWWPFCVVSPVQAPKSPHTPRSSCSNWVHGISTEYQAALIGVECSFAKIVERMVFDTIFIRAFAAACGLVRLNFILALPAILAHFGPTLHKITYQQPRQGHRRLTMAFDRGLAQFICSGIQTINSSSGGLSFLLGWL